MFQNNKSNTLELTPDDSHVGNNPEARPPSPESGLDSKQLKAALALAEGKTETQTAQLVEVNRSTIYRWQKQAAFVAEVNRLNREYVGEYRAKVRSLIAKATQTVEDCLDREDSDPLKLKAAM
jgi:hypothetical protein